MFKFLKLIVFSLLLGFIILTESQADNTYIMNSGDVYYGEKIRETDNFIIIKDLKTTFTVQINKQEIDEIAPLYYKIRMKNGHTILGSIISKDDDFLKVRTLDESIVQLSRKQVIEMTFFSDSDLTWPLNDPEAALASEAERDYIPLSNYQLSQSERMPNTIQPSVEGQHTTKQPTTERQNTTRKPATAVRQSTLQPSNTQQTNTNYYEQPTKKYKDNYAYIGAGLGTPSITNFIAGYHLKYFTFQIHGSIAGPYTGAQTTFYLNVLKGFSNSFSLKLGVCSGYWLRAKEGVFEDFYYVYDEFQQAYIKHSNKRDVIIKEGYYYYGASLNISIHDFFLEIGFSDGPSVGENDYIIGQIGFNYRFDLF